MAYGFDLVLEQSQKLVMTPELIQAIKILQLNTVELEEYVEEELLINPVLEYEEPKKDAEEVPEQQEHPEEVREPKSAADENVDWLEYIKERDYDDISYRQQGYSEPSDYTYEQFLSSEESLAEHLCKQLQMTRMDPEVFRVAVYIVESLDGNGYLGQGLADIAAQANTTPKTAEEALDAVQSLDPAGVGARDLAECLLLQVRRLDLQPYDKYRLLICEHLEDLAANRMNVIAKALDMDVCEAQALCDRLRGLEPKPGRPFGSSQGNRYLPADVIVENIEGEYMVMLNESASPQLSVSPYYRKILAEHGDDRQAVDFLVSKINSAVMLIKSIERRKHTILSVAEAIVRFQEDFLESGPNYLRPLTLLQVADEVGIHESTVSRTVNGKYIQTPRGLFELRYFFTGGTVDGSGEGVAAPAIKNFIRDIIQAEDPKHPVSDQAISERLRAEKGVDLARRTVAKYREALGIPSSSGRRRY